MRTAALTSIAVIDGAHALHSSASNLARIATSRVSSAEGGPMARSGPLLTEAQWKKIAPLLPKPPKQRKGGRPWIENRRVLEGILWILRSGARWQDLPEKFPHPSTCWRRLRDWEERGVWLNIWRTFLSELNERQQLKWSESFLDGSFAPAKKGAAESEKPSGAKGRSGWWWSTAAVFLWETTFTLHPRRKSNSRRRRSRRSG